MRIRQVLWLLAGAAVSAAAAAGDGQTAQPGLPRWEAGVVGGVGQVPDYPGSERTHTRSIVLPFLVYRGKVLRVDDKGVRGRLSDTPQWEFDLSATAAFSARSDASRQGMPPLDYLVGIGPQWIYKGLQAPRGGPTLHLKLRALMSTDLRRLDARGFSFDPELRWQLNGVAGTPAALSLSLQPTWASRSLQRYFYEVDPTQATATRPAYRARAGYLGTDLAATLSHRPARGLSWFVTVRLSALDGAANIASPLLRERTQLAVGTGLVWTPWRSAASAAD